MQPGLLRLSVAFIFGCVATLPSLAESPAVSDAAGGLLGSYAGPAAADTAAGRAFLASDPQVTGVSAPTYPGPITISQQIVPRSLFKDGFEASTGLG